MGEPVWSPNRARAWMLREAAALFESGKPGGLLLTQGICEGMKRSPAWPNEGEFRAFLNRPMVVPCAAVERAVKAVLGDADG